MGHHGTPCQIVEIRQHENRFAGADVSARLAVDLNDVRAARRGDRHFALLGKHQVALGYAALHLRPGSVPLGHGAVVFLQGNGVVRNQILIAVHGLLRVDELRPSRLDVRFRRSGLRQDVGIGHRGQDFALFHALALYDADVVQHAFVLRGNVDRPGRAHGEVDIVDEGVEFPVADVRHGQHRILRRLHLLDMAAAGVVDVDAVGHDGNDDADDAENGDFQIFLRVHGVTSQSCSYIFLMEKADSCCLS